MGQPRGEPTPLDPNQGGKLCFKCGFPNRSNDDRCMYCKTDLRGEDGFCAWIKQTYYVLLWHRELRQENIGIKKGRSDFFSLKSLGYFVFGVVLSGAGFFLFIEAVDRSSFPNAIISVLLLLYGFFTVKTLMTRN